MKDIAIYGAGGMGREVACLLNIINGATNNSWNFIGFFDDGKNEGFENEYGKVIGDIERLNQWENPLSIVLAIGNPKSLKEVSEHITNPLISFPNIIAPGSIFLDTASLRLGKGNIICPMASISCNITIGDFNIFNWRISLGHDVNIGNYNTFMPEVKISGEVIIGDENLFGAGSFVKQQLKIGNNITLSPLSSLLTKPKSNSLYIGNPAKIMNF